MTVHAGMTPEQFVLWLNGYLSGRPAMVNDEIHDQLAEVIGGVVKRRLLTQSEESYREMRDKQARANWPLPGPNSWGVTTATDNYKAEVAKHFANAPPSYPDTEAFGCAPVIRGTGPQCDEEQIR